MEKQRGEKGKSCVRERHREWDYTYECGIKKLFFLIPSSYNGLLSLVAYHSNHLKIFSFTFLVVVCLFGVLLLKCLFSHLSFFIVSALRDLACPTKNLKMKH